MSKFEIEYYTMDTKKDIVEARHDSEALDTFREEHGQYYGIKSVKYVYEGDDDPTEWYCMWWNGRSWNSKVVMAHNEDEIRYNIKDTLDFAVYDFRCCPNTPEEKEKLFRCVWD